MDKPLKNYLEQLDIYEVTDAYKKTLSQLEATRNLYIKSTKPITEEDKDNLLLDFCKISDQVDALSSLRDNKQIDGGRICFVELDKGSYNYIETNEVMKMLWEGF